ncbi:MAG: hypothetical protein ABI603_01665 [Acidobacteriota bacterium]
MDRIGVTTAAVYSAAAQLQVCVPVRASRWWPFLRQHHVRKQIAEAHAEVVKLRRIMTCEIDRDDLRKFAAVFSLTLSSLNTAIERRVATIGAQDQAVRDMRMLRDEVEDIAEAIALASQDAFVAAMAAEATATEQHADWREILSQM